MDENKVNYWIDVLLAISFLLVVVTGVLKFPGIMPKIFALTYQDPNFAIASRIHDWSGVAMAVLVFVHLVLHREWIRAMTKQIFRGED